MTEWVQNLLEEDVRILLIGASVFLGLLVFVFLSIGLASKRRERRAEREAERDAADNDAFGLIATETATDILTTGVPEAGLSETMLTPPAVAEKMSSGSLRDEAQMLGDIRRLEQEGDSLDLAKLYTERATLALSSSDTPVAQEYFLKGLAMAGLVSAPQHQAHARLSLGDISKSDGDLTTACEHWQLARELYRECGEIDKASEVEDRMSENQCPTDWVLNNF